MQSQSLHPRSNGAALPNNTASRGPGVRSVHFAPSVEMPLRTGGQSSILGRSRTRNAPYAPPSTAPSARSWVYPYNQHQPTPLPPSPTDQSSPLPGPFHQQNELHAILMGDNDDLDTDNTQTNSLGIDFGHHHTELPPSKNKGKKSIIGRVFRGVGTVFGKEPSSGDRKLTRKATTSYDTVPTLATYGDSSSSNANSATDALGPSTLGPGRVPYNVPTPILEVSETEDQNDSPPPDVLRLSDNIPPLQSRTRPPPTTITSNPSNQRPKSVSRKPVNAGASSTRFEEPPMTAESAIGHNSNINNVNNHHNPEDRTTVMIYDQNLSRAPTGVQTPLVISRHPSSTRGSVHPELGTGAGAGPLPFQPLRPTSFVATQQTHAAGTSVRDPVSLAPTRRTSIASPLAPRSRQLSLNRGVVGQATSASSIPDFPPGPYPPHPTSRAASIYQQPPLIPLPVQTTTATNPELASPISAHPLPTEDYLKMTLSPPSSKHTMTTSNTTYSSNPSFSSDLSPFARFVKTLYKMPWVSHDRVTVDYLPDHGLLGANVKAKRGKVKRMATWYRSMLASRRNSDNPTTDLLGRGGRGGGRRERRRQRDLDASLGTALAELGSPFAATKRRKGRTERSRRHHHHHHRHHNRHHPSSSRHQHHHHSSRRTTTTTMSDDSATDSVLHTTTPLAPAMYPYFPPFPIAFQPPFAQNDHSPPATAGLAGQPTAPYQHLFSPAPFYILPPSAAMPPGPTADKLSAHGGGGGGGVLDPNTKTSKGSVIPPVLVPGGVDREHIPGAFS